MAHEKFLAYLGASEEVLFEALIKELLSDGYKVFTDHVNYIFGIPTTEYVTPACLVAHLDTLRTSDKLDLTVIGGGSVLRNLNLETGCMGADDRAGAYIVMEIRRHLKCRPYILFTTGEEGGCVGVKEFVKQDMLFKHTNRIYAFLEYDRKGFNEVVVYDEVNYNLLTLARTYGYETHTGSNSDVRVLTQSTGIAHLNLSAGFVREHTSLEMVLLPALDFAVNTGTQICMRLRKQYLVQRPVPTPTLHGPTLKLPPGSGLNLKNPICEICGKRRPCSYLKHVPAVVCHKCIMREGGPDNITRTSLQEAQTRLRNQQKLSRIANESLPVCPTEGCPGKDMHRVKGGTYKCCDCGYHFTWVGTTAYRWKPKEANSLQRYSNQGPPWWEPVPVSPEESGFTPCWECGSIYPVEDLYWKFDADDVPVFVLCHECNADFNSLQED